MLPLDGTYEFVVMIWSYRRNTWGSSDKLQEHATKQRQHGRQNAPRCSLVILHFFPRNVDLLCLSTPCGGTRNETTKVTDSYV